MYNILLGAYTPVTMEGNIVVDGVLASCYASLDHDLAHLGMTPLRWFPEIIRGIFGEHKEFSAFAKMAEKMGKWLLPHGIIRNTMN